MSTTYTYTLSVKSLEKMKNDISNIYDIITNPKLLKFIEKKCNEELENICKQNLHSVENQDETSTYMSGMHSEIKDGVIHIYNNSIIDVSSKNVSETTKQNYPNGLSLAKVVEYGIGYTGSFTNTNVIDWEYDVNNHGEKGWYYQDKDGNFHWTNGFEGRLIFLKLKQKVKQNIQKWIYEYVNNELR